LYKNVLGPLVQKVCDQIGEVFLDEDFPLVAVLNHHASSYIFQSTAFSYTAAMNRFWQHNLEKLEHFERIALGDIELVSHLEKFASNAQSGDLKMMPKRLMELLGVYEAITNTGRPAYALGVTRKWSDKTTNGLAMDLGTYPRTAQGIPMITCGSTINFHWGEPFAKVGPILYNLYKAGGT
jgi:hypothetical protein